MNTTHLPPWLKRTIRWLAVLAVSALLFFAAKINNQNPPSSMLDKEVIGDFNAKEKYLNRLAEMMVSDEKIFFISDFAINECMPVSWPKDEIPTAEELKKLGGEHWEENGGIWQENGDYMSLETVLQKHRLPASKWTEYCSLLEKIGRGPIIKEPDHSINFAERLKRNGTKNFNKNAYPANTPLFLEFKLYPWYGKEMPKYLVYCSSSETPPRSLQVGDTDEALQAKKKHPIKWRFCRRLNDHWFIVRSSYLD